jgi:hypothetical protein
MPIRRSRLSREEEREYLASLRDRQARGFNVVIPRWLERACPLDIFIAGGPVTSIFDLPGGGAAYAIWVRLVARRPVTVFDCAMTTAWDDQIVLQGFFDARDPLWRLGHRDFPRREVLNMRIMDSLRFGYHKMVEGWILFTGLIPMPEAFRHGMTVPFTMVFLDQNENEICQGAELFVDRTWRPKSKFVRLENSLHAPRTPEMDNAPQNINLGKAPDTDAESLYKSWVASRGPISDAQRKAMAALTEAFRKLSPQPPR